MEYDFLTYSQVAAATNASFAQIEQWVTRGHFKPDNPTVPGRARRFTANDVTRVAILHFIVTQCRLPLPVGARLTDMLRRQPNFLSQLRVHEVDIFAVVDLEAATQVGEAFDEAFVKAASLTSSWDGVSRALREKKPTGAVVVNLSSIARQTFDRLMTVLEAE